MHRLNQEFHAISSATVCQRVCFGGHCIKSDDLLRPSPSVVRDSSVYVDFYSQDPLKGVIISSLPAKVLSFLP